MNESQLTRAEAEAATRQKAEIDRVVNWIAEHATFEEFESFVRALQADLGEGEALPGDALAADSVWARIPRGLLPENLR